MKAKNEAFVSVMVKCPVCSRESRHRYVKSKLYTPEEVENDQHVVKYRWENKAFEDIRPNSYHIWHCPFCHYCDERDAFRGKDDSGGKLELIQEKVLIAQRSPTDLLNKLGKIIDLAPEHIPVESALAAHILATYVQEETLSPNNRQYGKLARFYLRTAWLYREKEALKAQDGYEPGYAPVGFATIEEFFASLKEEWENLPLNEGEALVRAIECYKEELNRATQVDDVRRDVTIIFLLVDLYLRLGDLENAHKNVRYVFTVGTRRRQATRRILDEGVHSGKMSQKNIESMRSMLTWLNNAIERASDTADRINDMIFKEEYPRAREVVLKISSPTPKVVVEALREAEFHEVTCRRIAKMFSKKKNESSSRTAPAAESSTEDDELQKRAQESKDSQKSGGLFGWLKGE